MNADLIETRAQALELLDAEMITFGAYVALCRYKGWQAQAALLGSRLPEV